MDKSKRAFWQKQNEEPISVNAQDPRIAHKSIKGTSEGLYSLRDGWIALHYPK